jgi:hypothetical protein
VATIRPGRTEVRGDVRERRWIEEFQKKAGPRLREEFANDTAEMPKSLVDKLEELRKKEQLLMKRKDH